MADDQEWLNTRLISMLNCSNRPVTIGPCAENLRKDNYSIDKIITISEERLNWNKKNIRVPINC